ncbi:MAG: aromatic amino acid lyase, partial [Rhodobacteraceae bacterium]|nr:aromatic amino acid lyase [Paracoccaceae bacterium]
MYSYAIRPGAMTLAAARRIYQEPVEVRLDGSADAAVQASVDAVNQIVAEDRTVYGINTGFGLLANTRIERENLKLLQRSLVLSHATGLG